ncbi:CBU_0592 family membrane protein [Pseudarthrobacter sp. LT1]|uniref:CBU_0592 family membrane protein n=1 Tax=Pseudarthrobacter sp. LT1 TaxID=3111450 RepID=UPI002D779FDC|nr:YgjV family protein [Pseudarthrobacter sp. LT1]WRT14016.1 YgjV family protein [Pseudarthrobacter sp. LT1]
MELLWEIAGWAGAVAILSAYLSVSMGWLKAGKGFQTANLFGSVAFIINGTLHGAWPSVVTNIAWFLISAVALVRMRSEEAAAEPVEAAHVQYPGVPDSTGQLAVVEAFTDALPVVSSAPVLSDGPRLAV